MNMKKFLAGFQSRYWAQKNLRVFVQVWNYFNIQAQYRSFGDGFAVSLFDRDWDITVTLYAYLAGWQRRHLRRWSKKKLETKLFSYLLFVWF